MCGMTVNSNVLLSPDRRSPELLPEGRNLANFLKNKCAPIIVWGARGNMRKKSPFLCSPAWAKKQMVDLTAVHLAELSL